MQAECKCAIKQSQDISKQAYDKWKGTNTGFQVGSSVWLEVTNLLMDGLSLKLASKCHGLFKITEKLSDLMYCLNLPAKWKIHDVFHVNVLSEAVPNMIPNQWKPMPPPVKVNNEDFWVMEKYLDTCWFCNQFQFKIHWDRFSEEHDTWENTDDINLDDGPQVLEEGNKDLNLEVDFY
jgi:hypothetical protein